MISPLKSKQPEINKMMEKGTYNSVLGAEISHKPMKVFSDEVQQLLHQLSRKLLSSKEVKTYPDLVYFAYWIRHSNINRIKNKQSTLNRQGKGLCFHIAPSNTPINFAFSYCFSLLAGNANIVRLPSKEFPQVTLLIKALAELLPKFPDIEQRSLFVRYPRDSKATDYFSSIADARMIWGGDNTIQKVRSSRTKPRALDITFPDRYSISIIDGAELEKLNSKQFNQAVKNFYNDTYTMDQNACSSPQSIFWLNEFEQIKTKFWQKLSMLAKSNYQLQAVSAVDKLSLACKHAIEQPSTGKLTRYNNSLYVLSQQQPPQPLEALHGNCGYFFEYSAKSLKEITKHLSEKIQTVTYSGIEPRELAREIYETNCSGVDRIVPLGQALEIDVIWDGHNIIQELSREVVCI